MTREEAIEVLRTTVGFTKDDAFAPNWVDAFDRLGMLRLEEPRRVKFTLLEAVELCRGAYIGNDAFIAGMERLGYKIVEK